MSIESEESGLSVRNELNAALTALASLSASAPYEPADETILKDADIGVSVCGNSDERLFNARAPTAHTHTGVYDPAGTASAAVTAHLLTANEFTAIQEFSAGITGGVDIDATATGEITLTIDGKAKNLTLTGEVTLNFDFPAGATSVASLIVIRRTDAAPVISWPVGAIPLGAMPTMVANKYYPFIAWTLDGGTTVFIQAGAYQS